MKTVATAAVAVCLATSLQAQAVPAEDYVVCAAFWEATASFEEVHIADERSPKAVALNRARIPRFLAAAEAAGLTDADSRFTEIAPAVVEGFRELHQDVPFGTEHPLRDWHAALHQTCYALDEVLPR